MAVRMFYLLPMLLGRTYDVARDAVGVDIFSPEAVAQARVTTESYYRSAYKMVSNSKEIQDFFDVSGELALKIKGGKVSVKGMGAYLKDVTSLSNSVEILTRATFQTVTVTIPATVRPIPRWNVLRREDLGTHYVQTVTYGGELIGSVRFRVTRSEELENIRGEISAGLQGGSALELVAEGKLEKLQKQLEGRANMEISYYGTVPLEHVPSTIDGLRKLVHGFRSQVEKVNNGWGVPISVELTELSTLDSSFQKITSSFLPSEIEQLQDDLTELQTVNSALLEWTRTLPPVTPQQEQRIETLYSRVQAVLRVFSDVISKLNPADPDQMTTARLAYQENKPYALPGKFKRELRNLKRKLVVSDQQEERGRTTFVRWGSRTCEGSTGRTLYSGFPAAASRRVSDDKSPLAGGGANYLCLPEKPDWSDDAEVGGGGGSVLTGIRYSFLGDGPFDQNTAALNWKPAVCALCQVDNRTSVETVAGRTGCPDNWTVEYSGFVMSSNANEARGQFICVDRALAFHGLSESLRDDHAVQPVTVMSGTLPSDTYPDGSFLPCVACSR